MNIDVASLKRQDEQSFTVQGLCMSLTYLVFEFHAKIKHLF